MTVIIGGAYQGKTEYIRETLGISRDDMYFCTGHIGKSQEQQLTEERELNNFTRVLKLLISRDAYCREIVEIVDEENNPIV